MEIIHILAETFNSIILYAYFFLHNFLQFNHTFVSFVIKFIETVKETVSQNILAILNVLECYYRDFVVFLFEINEIIQFIYSVTTNVLYKVNIKVTYVVSNVSQFILLAYENISNFITCTQAFLFQTVENVIYILQLLINSCILILQVGPNLLILLFEIVSNCLYYLFTVIKTSVLLLTEGITDLSCRTGEAIYHVPVKAYFGAVLFLMLFYQHKTITVYLKAYFSAFFLMFVQIGKMINHVVILCWKLLMIYINPAYKIMKSLFSAAETENNDHATSSHFHREQSVPKNSIVKKYFGWLNYYCKKYLLKSRHAEDQIEQLQKELSAEREKHTCIICFDRPRCIILYPCRHMCICEECSANWHLDLQRCPLCRSTILDVFHVYT